MTMIPNDHAPRAVRRWPLGFLGMLLAVGLTERIVARHDLDFTNGGVHNWTYSRQEAARQTKPGMILCFGSSLTKHGIVSREIERQTGRRTFNLAVVNGNILSSYFLFKRALDAGARPAAVLVDYLDRPSPPDLDRSQHVALAANVRTWPELLGWGEGLDLAWVAGDAGFLAQIATSWCLPSYKARFEIRSRVAEAFRGETNPEMVGLRAARRNWWVNRGTMLLAPRTAPPAPSVVGLTAEGALRAEMPRDRFRRDRLMTTYARRFFALAAAHRVPVFYLIPPSLPGMQLDWDRSGLTRYTHGRARRTLAALPGVTVIDGSHSGYGSSVFWNDEVHLDRRGALAFTEAVGSIVARSLAEPQSAGRWVTLPDYREPEESVAAEDIVRSALVVQAEGPRRTR